MERKNKNSFTVSAFQFEEEFLATSKDLEKLRNDGSLMFQQVPMVEIDGMKLVQCRAILNYIAAKYNLYGKDLEKLRNDGSLMFQQVPMVEIDGMKLVQCRAILNYIAAKYNLYGKDIKERALIDMYVEGVADLNEMYLFWSISPPNEQAAKMTQMKDKIANRYLPAFEKVLKSHGQDYLVGNRLSRADIHLVELLYLVEELDPNLLANFPLLKALKARISNLPTVKKFLQPGSPRKPPMDEKCLAKVKEIFQLK
uniref:glutathione transferase n=1 Tax=Equus caballus TaxID=9796 RepID=A0A5F5PN67_HORSE